MKLIRNIFVALAALLFSASVANAGEKWDISNFMEGKNEIN